MLRGVFVALLVSTAVPTASAQTTAAGTGRVALTGVVADPSGAVLPGASIEVIAGGRSIAAVVAGSDGRYRVELATNGVYQVRVVLDGFAEQTFDVQTSSSDVTRDVNLQLGGINEAVVVTGVVSQHLTMPTPTGSRLELSPLQTPASVEIITGESMQVFADQTITAVASRATGIVNTSNAFGFDLSARGFNGRSSVMQLYDGMRMYVTTVTFPSDPWMADRLEVLRGPASVLYGEGAIGGAVNVVRKEPTRTRQGEVKISGASYDTMGLNAGSGGPLSEKLSYRVDLGLNRSGGWMERGESHNTAIAGVLRFDASDRVRFTLTHDYNDAHPTKWFGVPTMSGTFRREIRKNNYNVIDNDLQFKDTWTQLKGSWHPNDAITIDSNVYYLTSYKHWRNAEAMTWNAATNLVTLGSFLEIYYDQAQIGNRSSLRHTGRIAGRENHVVVGFDVNQQRLKRLDNSPYAGLATVDPFNPVLARFINQTGTFLKFDTDFSQYALFAENRLVLTDRWSVVGGLRHDRPTVHRIDAVNPAASFTETFPSTSGRLGVVFNPVPMMGIYAQYATAADPITTLVTTNLSQKDFDPATGRQWEAGIKSSFWRGRVEWTFAAFDIVKHKLLTRDAFDPGITVQVGQQSAYGAEASFAFALGGGIHLQANASTVRARYDDFAESVGGVRFSRNGNVPLDTPQRSANVIALWNFAPEWVANTAVRYVGPRYRDAANTALIASYSVVDATVQRNVFANSILGLTVRNLTDKVYARNLYGNAMQWVLGEPRAVELSLRVRF